MSPSAGGRKAGSALGRAGDWLQYVGGTWLAYTTGGTRAVALYLIAITLPAALLPRFRFGSLFAPAALALMAVSSRTVTVASIAVLGVLVGSGSAFAGRSPAWIAGIYGAPSIPGFLGAALGMVLIGRGMVTEALAGAAVVLFAAFLAGEVHQGAIPRERILVPAVASMAFVVGLRVLEPGLLGGPLAAGLLVTVWAAGTEVGWRAGPRTDARLVLGAPFMVAAALAGIGAFSDGPAILFLYAAVALGVGLVGGAGAGPGERVWPASWSGYLIVALAGLLWAVRAAAGFESVVWVAGGVAIIGGFVSSALARRVAAPETAPALESPVAASSIQARPATAAVIPEEALLAFVSEPGLEAQLQMAVEELAESMRRARVIRREAIAAVKAVATSNPIPNARARIALVVDELLTDIRDTAERLEILASSR